MTARVPTRRVAPPPDRRRPRVGPLRAPPAAVESPRLELSAIAAAWQRALDADGRAVAAAAATLPSPEVGRRSAALRVERQDTAAVLLELGRLTGAREQPWLSPVPVTPELLGLRTGVRACLFDVDGVLTDTGMLHASAWSIVFDDFLLGLSEKTHWHFVPFDRVADRAYVDGRSRADGVRAFLDSRGIHLPEGGSDDPASADTVAGLARRKGDALGRVLERGRAHALPGARRYLDAAGRADLARAVVSTSATTAAMLDRAGLAPLVDDRVDGVVVRRESLRARPAPDLLLAACRHLDVDPATAVSFTRSPAGVAAARTAGTGVVGIASDARADLLRQFGAERVVPSLAALIDRRLAAAS